ncbi:hypothetical protein BT63DRAFT_76857 [Microthyrium microscopicum]|uniref:Uncharacterized protein n=1 Tax=Microthyrium microscopicum TaxID=703497 RepID=A0A6A6U3I7_9PEZI|nr:hypothetical protein BT63DRAFT_76857 [Microthyrium microscopicum]
MVLCIEYLTFHLSESNLQKNLEPHLYSSVAVSKISPPHPQPHTRSNLQTQHLNQKNNKTTLW